MSAVEVGLRRGGLRSELSPPVSPPFIFIKAESAAESSRPNSPPTSGPRARDASGANTSKGTVNLTKKRDSLVKAVQDEGRLVHH